MHESLKKILLLDISMEIWKMYAASFVVLHYQWKMQNAKDHATYRNNPRTHNLQEEIYEEDFSTISQSSSTISQSLSVTKSSASWSLAEGFWTAAVAMISLASCPMNLS